MPVMPGAEPFASEGGPTGALLVHGFTGTPQGIRGWAEYLAAAGVTVWCPRLPGHGTRWQDMARTRWEDWYAEVDRGFVRLRQRCDEVFVMGLSMGATLSLRLAELHGAQVAGLVLVNASLTTRRLDAKLLLRLAPILSKVMSSVPSIASDIKAEGVSEVAYTRVPLPAAVSLSKLWAVTRADLDRVVCPILSFRSREDHLVEPLSGRLLCEGATNCQVEEQVLENSYHVATLDNDKEKIFAGSLEFVRSHTRIKI